MSIRNYIHIQNYMCHFPYCITHKYFLCPPSFSLSYITNWNPNSNRLYPEQSLCEESDLAVSVIQIIQPLAIVLLMDLLPPILGVLAVLEVLVFLSPLLLYFYCLYLVLITLSIILQYRCTSHGRYSLLFKYWFVFIPYLVVFHF